MALDLKIRNPLYTYSPLCLLNAKCFSAQKQQREIVCGEGGLATPTLHLLICLLVSEQVLPFPARSFSWAQREHGACGGQRWDRKRRPGKRLASSLGGHPCSLARWPGGGSSLRLVYAAGDSLSPVPAGPPLSSAPCLEQGGCGLSDRSPTSAFLWAGRRVRWAARSPTAACSAAAMTPRLPSRSREARVPPPFIHQPRILARAPYAGQLQPPLSSPPPAEPWSRGQVPCSPHLAGPPPGPHHLWTDECHLSPILMLTSL